MITLYQLGGTIAVMPQETGVDTARLCRGVFERSKFELFIALLTEIAGFIVYI